MKKHKLLILCVILFLFSFGLSRLGDVLEHQGIFGQVDFITRGFSTEGFGEKGDPLVRLDRFSRALYHVRSSYVDIDRIKPQKMFEKIALTLADHIPEVQTLFPSPQTAVIIVNGHRKEMDRTVNNLHALKSRVSDVLMFVRNHQVTQTSNEDLEIIAMQSALETLDPHSVYLSKENFEEMNVGTSGHFGGLGIVIGIREQQLTVIAPIEDTPAFKAGIKSGDVITQIGEEPTQDMPLSDAVDRMRGPKGTHVKITLSRKGWNQTKILDIIRDEINIASVESDRFENNVGYVRIKNFQKDTGESLKKHLKKLTSSAPLKGMILDMRGNPGGILDQAVEVSDQFLKSGVIVSTVGQNPRDRETEKATSDDSDPNYPLVVLVDEGSASASEIVAGALAPSRALIVGQQTFGKGTVQRLFELPEESALKLTIAQYLTPGDISIQSVGIVPDVSVSAQSIYELTPDPKNTSAAAQKTVQKMFNLFPNEDKYGEETLEEHFENENKTKKKSPLSLSYFEKINENDKKNFDEGYNNKHEKLLKDFEVSFARKVIENTSGPQKSDLIASAKKVIPLVQESEDQKISTALKNDQIDWSHGTSACTPKLSITSESLENLSLQAEGTATLTLKVKNNASCDAYQTWVKTKSKQYYLNEEEILFGKLPAGQELKQTKTIKIPKFIPKSLIPVNLEVYTGTSPQVHAQTQNLLSVKPLQTPTWQYDITTQPQNNAQSTYEVTLHLKNLGSKTSENASVSLKPKNKANVKFKKSHASIRNQNTHETKELKFLFDLTQDQKTHESLPAAELQTVDLILSVADYDHRLFQTQTVRVPLQKNVMVFPSRKAPNISTHLDTQKFEKISLPLFDFTGTVTSIALLKDLYILVNQKKVFYENLGNQKTKSFKATIPLEKGENQVFIVARDENDLTTTSRYILERE